MKNYTQNYLPQWVKEKLLEKEKGEKVQLTGTIFARVQEDWSVDIWSSTGIPITLANLK